MFVEEDIISVSNIPCFLRDIRVLIKNRKCNAYLKETDDRNLCGNLIRSFDIEIRENQCWYYYIE